MSESEKKELESLYKEKINNSFISPRREISDWKEIEQITSSDLFIKKHDKKTIGYFFVNKGQDLRNIIHEYAFHENFQQQELQNLRSFSLWDYHYNSSKENNAHFYPSTLMRIGNQKLFAELVYDASMEKIHIKEITDKKIFFSEDIQSNEIKSKTFLNNFFLYEKNIYISGLDSI